MPKGSDEIRPLAPDEVIFEERLFLFPLILLSFQIPSFAVFLCYGRVHE